MMRHVYLRQCEKFIRAGGTDARDVEIDGRLSRKFAHPEYASLMHARFKGNI